MRSVLFGENQFLRGRRSILPAAALIASSMLVTACTFDSVVTTDGSQPVTEVKVGDQWDTPFDRLGVVPLLPPSEDVRAGDIFAYPFNPDLQIRSSNRSRRSEISISPRWDSLDLLQELEDEYRLRPDWPAVADSYPQSAGGPQPGESSEPAAAQARSLFSPDQAPVRLRSFGVPELDTFTLSDAQANALVPSAAINLVFGSAWNDSKAISIRVNSAETYSLGLRKVISAALDTSGPVQVLREPYRNQLSLIADPTADSVWLRILSDVVYVRSIDIIIQSRSAFDEDEVAMASEFVDEVEETVTVNAQEIAADEARATGEMQAAAEGGESSGKDPKSENSPIDAEILRTETITEIAPDHALDPAYAAFVRADAINEKLIAVDADRSSASQLRFVSVTDDSVTVRRVWQRGLAIGARGLSLEVDKLTGAVLRSATMGSLIP
jgi:hypothetical protein